MGAGVKKWGEARYSCEGKEKCGVAMGQGKGEKGASGKGPQSSDAASSEA